MESRTTIWLALYYSINAISCNEYGDEIVARDLDKQG